MRFMESWKPATLVATRDLTPAIRELLIKPENFDGVAYPVGSHINIAVTIDGRPETRSYSLVGEADRAGYRIAVRRAEDSRGGSRYMWSLAPGARLAITLPASLPPDALTLLCGPMRMLDAARRAWTGAGRALSDLRYETFGSSGSLPTEGFRVRLAGRAVAIEIPRDRTCSLRPATR